jgi:excisionase family DNA binding protein
MNRDPPLLLTVDEAAARLSISRWTVYNLIRSGELASITIGRARRIPLEAVDKYITQRLEEDQ